MGRPKAAGTIRVQDQQREGNREQFGIRAHEIWRPAHFQMKRVLVAGRKVPLTPVPSWKLYENPFYEGILTAVQPEAATSGDLQVSVSARKLAATLWGMQDFPSLFSRSPRSVADTTSQSSTSDSCAAKSAQLILPPPSQSIYTPSKEEKMLMFHPSTKSIDLNLKGLRTNKHSQRQSHVHRVLEWREDNAASQFSSTIGHRSSIGKVQDENIIKRNALEEGRHGALESAGTSHELYKVLGRIRNLEEQNSVSTSLTAALHLELDHARQRIQELELHLKAARKEINSFQRKFANERAQLRATEQERTRSAMKAIQEELEEEKEKQRHLETTNKKLVTELADAKMALNKALQGFEMEKRARELMEDVCDELAREIGEDKADFEELKRESAKVKEEVEEERKMLQVAEVWREERVQMKLAEAGLEVEEKTEALNKLRCELQIFLDSRRSFELESNTLQTRDITKAEKLWEAVDALHLNDNRTSFELETAGALYLDENSEFLDLNNDTPLQESSYATDASNDIADELKEPDSVQLISGAITVKESKGGGKPSKSKSKVKFLDRFRRHHNRDDGCKESEWKHEHENQPKGAKIAIIPYANGFPKEKAKQVDYSTKEDGWANIGLSEVMNGKLDDKSTTTDHPVSEPLKGGTRGHSSADKSFESSSTLWRSISVGKQSRVNLQGDNYEGTEIIRAIGTRSSDQPYTSTKAVVSFPQQHVIRANSLPVFQIRGGWHSMDAGNSQMIKGTKSSKEWPGNTRDSTLRAKLLEAKLEGQKGDSKLGDPFSNTFRSPCKLSTSSANSRF